MPSKKEREARKIEIEGRKSPSGKIVYASVFSEAVDELGRPLEAIGTTVSRQVFTAYPSMFCWNSLVHWELDGADAWGEDQDVWHPRKWRDFAASLRTRAARDPR